MVNRMQNKERYIAEMTAIVRGRVYGQKKSSDVLRVYAKIRNKFTSPTTIAIHDNITARSIASNYID